MPKKFGQKIKLNCGNIRTKIRRNLTAIVWNDIWIVHIMTKCILHHWRVISVVSMKSCETGHRGRTITGTRDMWTNLTV